MIVKMPRPYTEYPSFIKSCDDCGLSVKQRVQICDMFAFNDAYPFVVVPGLGGIRKSRVAKKGQSKGKSGGYRFFYYIKEDDRIHFLAAIDKAVQDDLTPQEKKDILKLLNS